MGRSIRSPCRRNRGEPLADRTDNFNRTDSSTTLNSPSDAGGNYTVGSGTWGISSNRGYNVSNGTNETVVLESSQSDVTVQATYSTFNAGAGLCARWADDSNHLLFIADAGTGFRLYKKVAGSFTQLGSTDTSTPTSGDVCKIVCNGTSIKCYRNNVELTNLTVTESAGQTNTKHGLISRADTLSFWDDFSITGLGGGAAATYPSLALMGVG